MIKGGRVTIRTDHKPLLEIVAGMAKSQNSAAADKNFVAGKATSSQEIHILQYSTRKAV